MSSTAHTTVTLGDLVVMAFDWAEQRSSDPREVQILGVEAASYLLQRSWMTSPSRPNSGLLRFGPSRKQLVLEDAGRRPGASASTSG